MSDRMGALKSCWAAYYKEKLGDMALRVHGGRSGKGSSKGGKTSSKGGSSSSTKHENKQNKQQKNCGSRQRGSHRSVRQTKTVLLSSDEAQWLEDGVIKVR